MDARTFESCYRNDPMRRFMIRQLLPALAVAVAVGGFAITARFYMVFSGDLTALETQQLIFATAFLLFMFESLAALFYGLYRYLRMKILYTTIRIDDEGIELLRPNTSLQSPWGDVQRVAVTAVGRFQKATVHTTRGAIKFDATFTDVEAKARPRFTARLEVAQHADGTRVPMLIQQNTLLKAIRERVPERG